MDMWLWCTDAEHLPWSVLEKAIGYATKYFEKVDLVLLDYYTQVLRIAFEF